MDESKQGYANLCCRRQLLPTLEAWLDPARIFRNIRTFCRDEFRTFAIIHYIRLYVIILSFFQTQKIILLM